MPRSSAVEPLPKLRSTPKRSQKGEDYHISKRKRRVDAIDDTNLGVASKRSGLHKKRRRTERKGSPVSPVPPVSSVHHNIDGIENTPRTPEDSKRRKRSGSNIIQPPMSDANADNIEEDYERYQKRQRRNPSQLKTTESIPQPPPSSTPSPVYIRQPGDHDYTAGGIPPSPPTTPQEEELWDDMLARIMKAQGLQGGYFRVDWCSDATFYAVQQRVKNFADPNYSEGVQGRSFCVKCFDGRSVSPTRVPEPGEMEWREWVEFSRPVKALLAAVAEEGVEVEGMVYGDVRVEILDGLKNRSMMDLVVGAAEMGETTPGLRCRWSEGTWRASVEGRIVPDVA